VELVNRLHARWIWRRCYALLDEWAPKIRARLPAGVSAELLSRVEQHVGRPLPGVLVELYKQHNGLGWPLFINQRSQSTLLLSLDDALTESSFMRDALADQTLQLPVLNGSRGVRSAYWLEAWLPIATFGNGDKLFVDLDPTPDGRYGQIVEWSHEADGLAVRHAGIAAYMKELDVDLLAGLDMKLEAS
jgi:cell wall assembly regulator SMI1